jgi:hypothetical protein
MCLVYGFSQDFYKESHIMMKIEKTVMLSQDMDYYKLEEENILPYSLLRNCPDFIFHP